MIKDIEPKGINAVQKFRTAENLIITYDELSKVPINTVIQMYPNNPGAIEYIRITSNTEDSLMFTITMKEGQIWKDHHHNCCEVCVVFKGQLRDLYTGKEAGPAEMLRFKKYDNHSVVALKDSVFYVEFKKPIK